MAKLTLTNEQFKRLIKECVSRVLDEGYTLQQGTEEYERVIHSDRFKQWFGDWENNPESSSIVVSQKDGKPIICTHGTDAEFDTFSYDKINGGSMACHGYGFNFFATETDYTQYGKNTINAFINVRNPLSSEKKTITRQQVYNIIRAIDSGKRKGDTISYAMSSDAALAMDQGKFDLGIRIAARTIYEFANDDLTIYQTICQMDVEHDPRGIIKLFEDLGFDGSAEYLNGRLAYVIAFRQDQVKKLNSNFTSGEGNMNLE